MGCTSKVEMLCTLNATIANGKKTSARKVGDWVATSLTAIRLRSCECATYARREVADVALDNKERQIYAYGLQIRDKFGPSFPLFNSWFFRILSGQPFLIFPKFFAHPLEFGGRRAYDSSIPS
jgi:hypothetical protein